MIPHFHLLTLGSPVLLSAAGNEVRFRTRKHLALLIRLALASNRRVARGELMELFWPDVPERLARHSLAQAVTTLKHAIGAEHVVAERSMLALAEGAVHTDVADLERGGAEIRGRFLDGFEVPGARGFEHWKDECNARLLPRVRDALVRQMDAARRRGDFAAVERDAQLLLELDPHSEDGIRGVMEARAWVNDRANALKAFSRYADRIAEDLGATPSAELTRMAELLRAGRGTRPARGAVSECVAAPAIPIGGEPAIRMIGREREFATLYDAWIVAKQRRPLVFVLTGEPGIGKTTLTSAFLHHCEMEGAVAARVQAYEAEKELPFGVLAELVRQLIAQPPVAGADPEALAELARVSSEVRVRFPGVPPTPEWPADIIPLRLADALAKTLSAAADECPVAVALDDVHASDATSAGILHMAARKLDASRVMIILTARPTELRAADTARAFAEDTRLANHRRLALEPFGPDVAAQLVRELTAAGVAAHGQPPVEEIVGASSGNPLALALLAREWVERGTDSVVRDLNALDRPRRSASAVPPSIAHVFDRLTARLDPEARVALDLAAVLGRRLGQLELYEVVGLDAVGAARALGALQSAGLLRETDGALGFPHELLRAHAYYAVAAPARQRAHGEVGERLVRTVRREESLEVAWHLLRGGRAADAERLVLDSAREALSAGAPAEAEAALSALTGAPGTTAHAIERRLLLAKALLAQAKAEPAMRELDAILVDPSTLPEQRAECGVLRAEATYLMPDWLTRDFQAVADAALGAAMDAKNPQWTARALMECARASVERGDPAHLAHIRDATESLLVMSDYQRVPMMYYARAFCAYHESDGVGVSDYLDRALELDSRGSDPSMTVKLHNGRGIAALTAADLATARHHFAAAQLLAERIGDPRTVANVCTNLAIVAFSSGDYREASRIAQRATALGRSIASRWESFPTACLLARSEFMVGNPDRARDVLAQLPSVEIARHQWHDRCNFGFEAAGLALLLQQEDLALEILREPVDLSASREAMIVNRGECYKYRAYWIAKREGFAAAEALVDEALTILKRELTLPYLDTLATKAWIERHRRGEVSRGTQEGLKSFDHYGLRGRRELLIAQGFLPPNS